MRCSTTSNYVYGIKPLKSHNWLTLTCLNTIADKF